MSGALVLVLLAACGEDPAKRGINSGKDMPRPAASPTPHLEGHDIDRKQDRR